MDGYDSNRRDFLAKLGLLVGAATLSASEFSKVSKFAEGSQFSEVILDKKDQFKLTPEQSKFMSMYEKWLDEFHDMAKFQKIDSEHSENNKKLVALSEEAKKWQNELIEYMKDENFARHYMIVTEKVTATI
ncbi:MAG TPA: twin-arginine translocation signal domain-containing protein [Paludibacter sp.]